MLDRFDWTAIAASLDTRGWAVLSGLLSPTQCAETAARYDDEAGFRSRVVMARHGFGRGEYRYFAYPLPETVATLRAGLYPPLAAIANIWHHRMGIAHRFPPAHADFLTRCHQAGAGAPHPAAAPLWPGRL